MERTTLMFLPDDLNAAPRKLTECQHLQNSTGCAQGTAAAPEHPNGHSEETSERVHHSGHSRGSATTDHIALGVASSAQLPRKGPLMRPENRQSGVRLTDPCAGISSREVCGTTVVQAQTAEGHGGPDTCSSSHRSTDPVRRTKSENRHPSWQTPDPVLERAAGWHLDAVRRILPVLTTNHIFGEDDPLR